MSFSERALSFACAGDSLIGIVALPHTPSTSTGVLVVVGGPQYRVGSHRQFVLLSRALAQRGIPCMRFDYRGMGDASGDQRSFDAIDADIRAAIDAFCAEAPSLERIVIWGLCDGASAACLYAPRDERLAGLVLLNPWVRTDAGLAKTYLKHHYLKRAFDPKFWKKLFSGQVAIRQAARELVQTAGLARAAPALGATDDLPTRMAGGLQAAPLPLLVILSGRDYVANEFDQISTAHPTWPRLLAAATVERLATADHTFSSAQWRDAVAEATRRWLEGLRSATTGAQHGTGA